MEKYAKFEVPAQVLGDFIQEVSDNGFTSTNSAPNRRGEYVVTVPYDKEQEDEIEELEEYLDDLISDSEEEEEENEEEDDDKR
ncbi:MAG: hypothetical protein ABIQ40_10920 [Bacteroidia bacterium]